MSAAIVNFTIADSTVTVVQCGIEEFDCGPNSNSRQCINNSLICNGNNDCDNGADEANCGMYVCNCIAMTLHYCYSHHYLHKAMIY